MWPVLNDYFMTHLYAEDKTTQPSQAVSFAPTTYVVIIIVDPLGAYLQKRANLRYLAITSVSILTVALIGCGFCK